MNEHTFAQTFAFNGKIDRANRVIYGVSVATEGEARGHGVFLDATTISQMKACCEKYANGLKVKGDHGTGVFATIGYLSNFQIDGVQLRADLHVLPAAMGTPENPGEGARLFDMAESIPDTFGISVFFSGLDEDVNGVSFARCEEMYSADVVTEPAANPSGLFSRKSDDAQLLMLSVFLQAATHTMTHKCR